MDTDEYYNSQNLDYVFNVVNDIVFQNTNVKIKDHTKTRQQFQKMAHIVANKFLSDGITLVELNDKLNNNAVSFFTSLVMNKKLGTRQGSNVEPVYANVEQIQPSTSPQDYLPPVQSSAHSSSNVLYSNEDTKMKLLNNSSLNQSQYTIKNPLPDVIGTDLPLFDNINNVDMSSEEDIDLENRVNDYLTSRNNIMSGVDELPSQRAMYESSVNASNTNNNKHVELVVKEQELRNNLSSGQIDMYERFENEINKKFAKITERIETALITPKYDETLFQALYKAKNDMQPKYKERSNYIIVNSADRDWLNEPLDSFNRYNFNLKFGKHDNSASINNVYKNITSIELVNAFMPKDNVLLGFDSRPYIDILTYPYLVLKIPELTNVFRGTNNSTDNAFSVLVYDKKHDSQVLSNDFITGSNSIVQSVPDRQFYSEYNKSYYKYIPAYFEKKVYDNQPLASLSHMSISVVNPNNENINVMRDVMSVDDIGFSNSSVSYEYSFTNSYPNDASAASREYINISVSQAFSNKLYRLGDNIKLGGFTAASGSSANELALVEYLNRSEGHYILNLQQSNLAAGANQGFISNLYIAPPGDININTTGSLNGSTYIGSSDIATLSNISTSGARLLNTNLQTHFLFKINTREGDFQAVHNAMNI